MRRALDNVDSRNGTPAHVAHSPGDYGVVPFSIIKWPPFQLSRFKRGVHYGPFSTNNWSPIRLTKTLASLRENQQVELFVENGPKGLRATTVKTL